MEDKKNNMNSNSQKENPEKTVDNAASVKNNNKKTEHNNEKKEKMAVIGENELAQLKAKAAERDEYYERMLKTLAESDNLRKRLEKEKSEHVKYANEGIILEFLGILDNFERGVKFAEQKKDFDLLHQGVEMILKQIYKLLEEKGLKKIASKGEKFDPYRHEVLEVVEGEKEEDGKVSEELQSGYELNGRVIRPGKVKVIRANENNNEKDNIKEE
ncbi:MAG TPA: nucleotide exchange factor GrpE [Candidatus Omnitrophota bacterium]|nr:nucleotide exchange factor GrpE [Candidatus Omnitrophota bacterium]HPS19480.1 nucleotide exchange factor GrpE [Candidatus Omnitrophota bacterium]